MNLAIIGAGNVGGALGARFASAGHSVTFGVRDPGSAKAEAAVEKSGARITTLEAAVTSAEAVFVTVPTMALAATIQALGDLSGKTLVDCTNAVGATFRPATDPGATIAEYVATLAPSAHVVKAFNTIGWQVMINPVFGDRRAVLPICGDSADAKAIVAALARSIDLDPLDVGPLEAAPLVEAFAAMWIGLAHRLGKGTDFAFSVIERPN